MDYAEVSHQQLKSRQAQASADTKVNPRRLQLQRRRYSFERNPTYYICMYYRHNAAPHDESELAMRRRANSVSYVQPFRACGWLVAEVFLGVFFCRRELADKLLGFSRVEQRVEPEAPAVKGPVGALGFQCLANLPPPPPPPPRPGGCGPGSAGTERC